MFTDGQTNQGELTGYPSIDKPWLKYYTEEAINAPLPKCTLYEQIWQSNREHLHETALNYYGHKVSYGEMFTQIERAAKAFAAFGVESGEIVMISSVNTPESSQY